MCHHSLRHSSHHHSWLLLLLLLRLLLLKKRHHSLSLNSLLERHWHLPLHRHHSLDALLELLLLLLLLLKLLLLLLLLRLCWGQVLCLFVLVAEVVFDLFLADVVGEEEAGVYLCLVAEGASAGGLFELRLDALLAGDPAAAADLGRPVHELVADLALVPVLLGIELLRLLVLLLPLHVGVLEWGRLWNPEYGLYLFLGLMHWAIFGVVVGGAIAD